MSSLFQLVCHTPALSNFLDFIIVIIFGKKVKCPQLYLPAISLLKSLWEIATAVIFYCNKPSALKLQKSATDHSSVCHCIWYCLKFCGIWTREWKRWQGPVALVRVNYRPVLFSERAPYIKNYKYLKITSVEGKKNWRPHTRRDWPNNRQSWDIFDFVRKQAVQLQV
jgi:hypothetical protein